MKVQYFTRNKQTRITQFEHEYRRTVSLTSYTHAHWILTCVLVTIAMNWSSDFWFLRLHCFFFDTAIKLAIYLVSSPFFLQIISQIIWFFSTFSYEKKKIYDEKYGNQKIELRITFSIPRIITIWILSSSFNFSVQMPWFFRYKLSTKTDLIFICFRFCCAFSMQCHGEHGK